MSKNKTNTPVSGQRMTPLQIRGYLLINGFKYIDIAKQLGVNKSAITLIITGRQNSRRIQEAIAKAINMPFEAVWGEQPFPKSKTSYYPLMAPHEIQTALDLNNVKVIDLAKSLGITYLAVYQVIKGQSSSRRIQEAIAKAINMPFEKVWGKKIA